MNAQPKELTNEEFIDILNKDYGVINICRIKYNAGNILKEIDPITYEQEKTNYEDSMQIFICEECDQEFDSEEDAEECCHDEDENEE